MSSKKGKEKLEDYDYQLLLEELECPICTDYLTLPIKQCVIGHSVCGKCIERLETCGLCRTAFTETRNYSLEAIAKTLKYPCINKEAGCTKLLSYDERENHEKCCNSKELQILCQMKGCTFIGDLSSLRDHWINKEDSSRIYGAYNKCYAHLNKFNYYANLIEAYNEMFWFKSKVTDESIYFAIQYIGKPENAHKFFYQIEISHTILHKKQIIMNDYCKSITLTDDQLFYEDICVVLLIDTLEQFLENNEELCYILRVLKVNNGPRRFNHQNKKNFPQKQERDSGASSNYSMGKTVPPQGTSININNDAAPSSSSTYPTSTIGTNKRFDKNAKWRKNKKRRVNKRATNNSARSTSSSVYSVSNVYRQFTNYGNDETDENFMENENDDCCIIL